METDSHGPLGAPGNSGPAGFAFDRPKASAREFHQKQNASLTGKPSWASRAGKPGGVVSPEGLRRLLPEPTPSPRLWAAAPGATPERLCEHTMRVSDGPSKPELSTWLETGTFYLAPTLTPARQGRPHEWRGTRIIPRPPSGTEFWILLAPLATFLPAVSGRWGPGPSASLPGWRSAMRAVPRMALASDVCIMKMSANSKAWRTVYEAFIMGFRVSTRRARRFRVTN